MVPEPYKIEVDNKVDSLPVIGDFIEDTLTRLQADQATIFKVQLVVDEACTNIINYAYSGGPGTLILALELVGEDIVITIRDRGKPFDPTSMPPADISSGVEQRKIGGLGIHFMRTLMDSVNYSFDPGEGNTLIMRKKIASGK
jgi:serine/threonine-protein kinase RsbW